MAANSKHAQLAEWLEANRCGWKKYYITLPAPETIVISADFSLYIRKNSVFLGQTGETILVKTLTESEVEGLREMLFAASMRAPNSTAEQ